MNDRANAFTIDLLNILQRFLITFSLIALILMWSKSYSIFSALFLFPAPIISYLIRKTTKQLWSFLILHGCLLVFYFVAPPKLYILNIYFLYAILVTCYSFYYRLKSEHQKNTSIFLLLIYFLIHLLSYHLKFSEMIQMNFILAIGFILLNLITMYLLNFRQFMINNAGTVNTPYHNIRISNNTLIMFLISIFFIVMMLFTQLPLQKLLSIPGKLLLRILQVIISTITSSEIIENKPESLEVPEEILTPREEPPQILRLLIELRDTVLTVAIFVGILVLLLYLLYKGYQYFYAKKDSIIRDRIEFINPFKKKEPTKRKEKRTFRSIFTHTNNDMIRKHFYKAVISSIPSDTEQLPKALTPSELSEFAIKGDKSEIATTAIEKRKLLTTYYEKARYSNEECNREEVETVKNIAKHKI